MTKICNNCGKAVRDTDNFCPNCRGTSFKNKNEIVPANDSVVDKLFYWNYDGQYALSKSKIAGIVGFLLFAITGISYGWELIIFAIGFGALTFFIGYFMHQMLSRPSQAKLDHNDYGLMTDLKHFFFYWQNNKGQYVLSKTKIISHLVFLMFFGVALMSSGSGLAIAIIVAMIFEAPVFIIGYGIHKLINPNPEAPAGYIEPTKQAPKVKLPKKIKPKLVKNAIIPEYMPYISQLDELNSKFNSKEKSARSLIEKRFEPPQMTYTRFIDGVDKSAKLFKKQSDAAYSMINLADEYSPRVATEIEAKIDILKSITEKLDNLSNELLLSDDMSRKEDVEGVIGEMDDLINSVKDYDQQ